eukprot:TRINITY_DN1875_c0_g3_i1.p1 TRINITY_DN1875_c0_g3~~TRINITY_DN1875_c0_g3_i1.p1  ORF type:complete len:740 (-),score=290.38 TRINITY_DN1875_c0_g3_i1:683-2902(-)
MLCPPRAEQKEVDVEAEATTLLAGMAGDDDEEACYDFAQEKQQLAGDALARARHAADNQQEHAAALLPLLSEAAASAELVQDLVNSVQSLEEELGRKLRETEALQAALRSKELWDKSLRKKSVLAMANNATSNCRASSRCNGGRHRSTLFGDTTAEERGEKLDMDKRRSTTTKVRFSMQRLESSRLSGDPDLEDEPMREMEVRLLERKLQEAQVEQAELGSKLELALALQNTAAAEAMADVDKHRSQVERLLEEHAQQLLLSDELRQEVATARSDAEVLEAQRTAASAKAEALAEETVEQRQSRLALVAELDEARCSREEREAREAGNCEMLSQELEEQCDIACGLQEQLEDAWAQESEDRENLKAMAVESVAAKKKADAVALQLQERELQAAGLEEALENARREEAQGRASAQSELESAAASSVASRTEALAEMVNEVEKLRLRNDLLQVELERPGQHSVLEEEFQQQEEANTKLREALEMMVEGLESTEASEAKATEQAQAAEEQLLVARAEMSQLKQEKIAQETVEAASGAKVASLEAELAQQQEANERQHEAEQAALRSLRQELEAAEASRDAARQTKDETQVATAEVRETALANGEHQETQQKPPPPAPQQPTWRLQSEQYQVVAEGAVKSVGVAFKSMPPVGLTIRKITAGGWADIVGLEAGDDIIEMNGSRVADMQPQEFMDLMRVRPLAMTVRKPAKKPEEAGSAAAKDSENQKNGASAQASRSEEPARNS